MADGQSGSRRTDGMVPPQDIDAEGALLSAVMIDAMARDRVLEFLQPEHFYAERHRRIFEAIAALAGEARPVDVVTVGTRLKDAGRIAQVGGMAYLTEILNTTQTLSPDHVVAYGRTIEAKAMLRRLIATCQRVAAEGYGEIDDVDAFLDRAEAAVYEVARSRAQRGTLRSMREVATTAFAQLTESMKRGPGTISGIPTGFHRVDRVMAGLHDGDLTVVAARPGMGKTSLVMNIAGNVATIRGAHGAFLYGAMVFSLEMPSEQIAIRAICSDAKVDLRKTRTNTVEDDDWSRLTAAAVRVGRPEHYYLDDAPIGLMELRAKARTKQAELRRRGMRLGLIAVDYLQLMKGRAGAQTREQEISEMSRGLKQLAKELRVPIIALSQLNRGVENRSDKRPNMSDLRESGAIEQDADNILFVYRDDYYNAESKSPGVAEIIISKQRNGPTGTIELGFQKETTTFYNLPEDAYG